MSVSIASRSHPSSASTHHARAALVAAVIGVKPGAQLGTAHRSGAETGLYRRGTHRIVTVGER